MSIVASRTITHWVTLMNIVPTRRLKMKLIGLFLASCLLFAIRVDSLSCYQCSGTLDQCENADDTGKVTDCTEVLSCYAGLTSKRFRSRWMHKTFSSTSTLFVLGCMEPCCNADYRSAVRVRIRPEINYFVAFDLKTRIRFQTRIRIRQLVCTEHCPFNKLRKSLKQVQESLL